MSFDETSKSRCPSRNVENFTADKNEMKHRPPVATEANGNISEETNINEDGERKKRGVFFISSDANTEC